MESRFYVVPDGLDGLRADAGIARLTGLSRAAIADIIAAGGVSQDGKQLAKSDQLVAGASLDVAIPPPAAPPENRVEEIADLRVVFDDDHLVVVSKPVGVAAHASPGWDGPTVLGGLAAAGYRIATGGIHERQGIVHRLDVGTSGLMAVAKSERAYSVMKDKFRHREVTKVYLTCVQGLPDPHVGTIEAPIGRHPKGDGRMAITAAGKPSVTHYELLEAFRRASLLRVHLETGRTHQIRVHMQGIKHPCVGDPQYGGDPRLAKALGLTRQWLHAAELSFAHPISGEQVQLVDEIPADLARALELLRAGEPAQL